LRPRLHIAAHTSEAEVGEAADAGGRKLGASIEFGPKDVRFTPQEFRKAARDAVDAKNARLSATLAALGSDAALKRDGENIEPTPYCMMLGQGHQHFLERLQDQLTSTSNAAEEIRNALFELWQYNDSGESFRWDPIEDRRYAHQFGNPSKQQNKLGTVGGANRLAAIGFGYLVCAPGNWGLTAIGVRRRRQEIEFFWPLPKVKTSLTSYLSLLGHPDLIDSKRCLALSAFGVVAIARARRIQSGKFFSVERAHLTMLSNEEA
jgi:hypothetical protein